METNIINSVLDFWIPKDEYQEFWFDKTPDKYIIDNYLKILNELEEKRVLFHKLSQTIKGKLVLIIFFDQFTRNIYRDSDDKYKNDTIAFKIAEEIFNNNHDTQLNLSEKIFCLMPYRHSRCSDNLDFVLNKIKIYEYEYPNNKLLNKFKLATFQSYTNLYDRIILSNSVISENNSIKLNNYSVLDNICSNYKQELSYDIDTISKKIIQNILYSTLLQYFEKKISNIEERNIGVSLSGGVDSMVILFVLYVLKYNKKINSIYAIHLEYANRDEAYEETNFLINYCNLLDIPIYIRKINYMSRTSVDRNFYESETKKARFNSYKYLIEKHNIKGFCMGHHFGDLGENVLMNIFNGRDILDLFVMEDDSIIDDVRLFRPLLQNPKNDIYYIAHIYEIPYFKDSTPDWSCRGVLRRKIMPVLTDQWGLGIYNNLADIGKKSQELNTIVNKFIINEFMEKVNFKKNGCKITLHDKYLDLPEVIWSNIFLQIFHKLGKHMISKKNLTSFLCCIKERIKKSSQFNFSNDTITIIDYKDIYIFTNNFIIDCNPQTILLNKNYESENIRIFILDYDEDRENRNPMTYDNILDGYYHYTEQLNDTNEIYIVNKFDDLDKTRKLFTKVPLLKQYIPKLTSGKTTNKKYIASISLYF